jgi:ABC-2 type transport system ATP-binding protein
VDGASPLTNTDARRRISFVPAIPELSGFLTVAEAWRLLAALRGAPTWDGAALADSLGLDPTRRLDQLSVGQRRKAELIAGLAGDPAVLLLDEPFAPLDTGSAARLAAHLDTLRGSHLLVVTGHGALPIAADGVLEL